MKAAHQGRAAVGPVAGCDGGLAVDQQSASAAALAQRFKLERECMLAHRCLYRRQAGVFAEAVVDHPQFARLDTQHQAAEDFADRKEHALIGGTMIDIGGDAKVAVGDQRNDQRAVDGLSARQEAARALFGRAHVRRNLVELLDGVAVVQRIDHVRPGRLVEGLDQFAQTFGVFRGDVDRFREVGRLLVQGPVVEIDLVALSLQRHRHPAVAPVGPVGPALVVLLAAHRVGGFAAHDLREARAVHRQGVFAVRSGKRRDASQIEQGRHDIGHMGELRADRAGIGDLIRPGNNEAHPSTATTGIGLEGRKGRVADLAPAHWIERRDFAAADFVALGEIGLERQRRQAGKAPVEIDIAIGAGRTRAAVVG